MPDFATSRRNFLKKTSLLYAASLFPFGHATSKSIKIEKELEIHVFSKHLQFLDYAGMAKAAAKIGFDGVDLTVRPGGHVLPERVSTDLPGAISAIKAAGLRHKMITTAVQSASDEADRNLLETAAGLGVKFYRMNWLKYDEKMGIAESLPMFQECIAQLAGLNEKLGIAGCYQNHAGLSAGASIWELWQMLEGIDPRYFGVQYDVRHATVEGGLSWENGLRLIQSSIKTIVIKDFKWEKINGKWQVVNTPVGEGMVDFNAYFKMLKSWGLNVPVSLHLEYPLGGAEKGKPEITCSPDVVFDAMKKDLETVRRLWREA